MRLRRTSTPHRTLALMIGAALALSGCAVGAAEPDDPLAELLEPDADAATPSAEPRPTAPDDPSPLAPTGATIELATDLTTPWSIVPLPTGSTLLSERDTARVLELTPEGTLRVVGTVPGVVPFGEGGLLGLAARDVGTPYLYVFHTATRDNRIVRFELTGAPGSYGLGASEVLVSGIPKARTHNGGRLAFGPDGMLYATTGDAQEVNRSQDRRSLAGKILRLTPEGDVPADNPFAGSYVYSFGHRNPQGLAFDRQGRLWASELGQNTWDELNLIEAGSNYGWPIVEGIGNRPGFVDPVQQWATSEASPSGLGIVGDTLFMVALRGQRLWVIDVDEPGRSTAHFVRELGRLRDAVAAPDGGLYLITTNTDANGRPGPKDDRLLAVPLAPRG